MAPTPPPAPTPAYADAPRRHGLLYAIVGVSGLVALVVLALVMFGGGRDGAAPAPGAGKLAGDAEARKSLDAAKAALDQASRDVLQPAGSPPLPLPSGATPAPDASPEATPPPRVAVTAEPPRPAARPVPAAPPRPATSTPPTSAPPPSAPAPAPVIIPAPAAPPPAQVASADRWGQMRDEMERCDSRSVIPRRDCQHRIRVRYCDGYWGRVPDCPSNPRGG